MNEYQGTQDNLQLHPDVTGEGPWEFIAIQSKNLKIALGRGEWRYNRAGDRIPGLVVWADFRNFTFVAKDAKVASMLCYNRNYKLSFTLSGAGKMVKSAPSMISMDDGRSKRPVSGSEIKSPLAIDGLPPEKREMSPEQVGIDPRKNRKVR